jgi:hypothetical protein
MPPPGTRNSPIRIYSDTDKYFNGIVVPEYYQNGNKNHEQFSVL